MISGLLYFQSCRSIPKPSKAVIVRSKVDSIFESAIYFLLPFFVSVSIGSTDWTIPSVTNVTIEPINENEIG